jgi:hypothetical protein
MQQFQFMKTNNFDVLQMIEEVNLINSAMVDAVRQGYDLEDPLADQS